MKINGAVPFPPSVRLVLNFSTVKADADHNPQLAAHSRKPIALHNSEMDAHSRQWFAPDPGKTPRLFFWSDEHRCNIASSQPIPPRPGFLNYPDKFEIARRPDGSTFCIVRRDMTDREFAGLPVVDAANEPAISFFPA